MKEIKFRIWDDNHKKMKYNIQDYWTFWNGNELTGIQAYLILEQFTGMKDRNGAEIYEGDIMPYEWGDGSITNEIVDFEDGCFWLGDQAFIDITRTLSRSEVVGNVHENPELIV